MEKQEIVTADSAGMLENPDFYSLTSFAVKNSS